MAGGFHPPLEEYLEAIHALAEEGTTIIQARLVERLGHSPQAVSEMVRRLASAGYLERRGRGVALTPLGQARAESVVRKHRLAERFLVDVLGLAWDRAHDEAGRWEHVISDEVEARFVELLGHPTTCPHGNPIPGAPRDEAPQVPMADVVEGQQIRLARITERVETDRDVLAYLGEHGLVPGRRARVASRAPDGTVTLELDGVDGSRPATVAVGAAMCRELYVTDAPAAG
ncbi:MAG TPA: metal-dependent transcriptional regulator [Acidimicrobiales bacterium]|jgi:DtxR family Mn-dependent transcriptional regulator|nr:metal-dependent transcriptional regulator [Acidimicrobiales bacterium]